MRELIIRIDPLNGISLHQFFTIINLVNFVTKLLLNTLHYKSTQEFMIRRSPLNVTMTAVTKLSPRYATYPQTLITSRLLLTIGIKFDKAPKNTHRRKTV